LDKETKPVSLTHELPASNHGSSEALSRTTQGTHLSANQSAAPTDSGVDSDPVSTLDRARFVQRVTRAFQSAHARDGVIQLRLSPPELGSLRIAISTHQGVVSAKVEADTAAARNVILDNLPALRERLAEQQIRLEKFDVDVRRDGDQDTGNWNAQDRQSPRFAERPGGPTRLRQPTALPVQAGRALGGVNESGLDVRI
jgi:flagellar hook-length control protein FliK